MNGEGVNIGAGGTRGRAGVGGVATGVAETAVTTSVDGNIGGKGEGIETTGTEVCEARTFEARAFVGRTVIDGLAGAGGAEGGAVGGVAGTGAEVELIGAMLDVECFGEEVAAETETEPPGVDVDKIGSTIAGFFGAEFTATDATGTGWVGSEGLAFIITGGLILSLIAFIHFARSSSVSEIKTSFSDEVFTVNLNDFAPVGPTSTLAALPNSKTPFCEGAVLLWSVKYARELSRRTNHLVLVLQKNDLGSFFNQPDSM